MESRRPGFRKLSEGFGAVSNERKDRLVPNREDGGFGNWRVRGRWLLDGDVRCVPYLAALWTKSISASFLLFVAVENA